MSTVGNGLAASQDCLNYIASFNAAAQSHRDEAIDAIASPATGKIAFGANTMNVSNFKRNRRDVCGKPKRRTGANR
jgi:hypothetical protein